MAFQRPCVHSDTSQSFSVPSLLPESTNLPSGEKDTELTSLECAAKERRSLPLDASQSLSVLSDGL